MRPSWQKVTLDSVTKVVNGGTPKTKVADYWDGSLQWITPAEMGKRATPYVNQTRRKLTDAGLKHSSANLLPAKSVILSTRAPIGHLVINNVLMAFNQGCRGIVPSSKLHYKFLYYFLYGSSRLLNDLGTGTTFKELSASKLKKVELPLPSVKEQQRIVSILDEAFAGIEKAIANTEKNLANAQGLFESFAKHSFESCESNWPKRSLAEISNNLDSKRVPITKSKRIPGEIPYYGASGVVDHVADFIFDEDLLLVSEDGANLLARTYPIAFSISGKSWVNNHAHILKFSDIQSQRFIEYYLNSISLVPYVSGMAQPKLNQRSLNSIPVPFPDFPIRAEVVERLDFLNSQRSQLEIVYQQKLVALQELKQSLLQKAFSGELTANKLETEVEEAVA